MKLFVAVVVLIMGPFVTAANDNSSVADANTTISDIDVALPGKIWSKFITVRVSFHFFDSTLSIA